MILINPMKNTRKPALDEVRWHINYIFADYLRKFIEIKGGNARLSRMSEAAEQMSLKALKTNYSPAVTITVDCYTDIDPTVSGYDIECDNYNALVGTINYEVYLQGKKPIREIGYKETGTLKYGKYTDITLYLGYLSNGDDRAWLENESNLELLAKRIIEGAYGPPVKSAENIDQTGNNDAYFYRIDTWKEFDHEEGASTAEIKESTYSGLPLRYLSIDSYATGNYPVPELEDGTPDPEAPVIPRHYTWYTPLTYTSPTTCLFIGSVKAITGEVTAYIKVGNTEYTELISDTTYRIIIFEAEVNAGDYVQIGVQGTGRLDYSGIWVAPKGSLGTLDDPRATYSIFPPGYRSVSRMTSAYNTADAIHIALTSARSLIERAQDSTREVIGSQITKEEAAAQYAPDSSSSPLSFIFTTVGYANALANVMEIINNVSDKTKLNIVDPSTIVTDYKALENSMASISSVIKQTEIQATVNDIKAMEDAVKDLTITAEELEEKALKISEKTKRNIEAKGVALGT